MSLSKIDDLYRRLSNKRINKAERDNIYDKILKIEKTSCSMDSMGVCVTSSTSKPINIATIKNIQKQKELKLQKRKEEKQLMNIYLQKQKETEELNQEKQKEEEDKLANEKAMRLYFIEVANEWDE